MTMDHVAVCFVLCRHTHVWDMLYLTVVKMLFPLPGHILHALHTNSAHLPSSKGVPKATQAVKKNLTLWLEVILREGWLTVGSLRSLGRVSQVERLLG